MPHAEVWELFCEARASADAYEKHAGCMQRATDIVTRVERTVAESAAALAGDQGAAEGSDTHSNADRKFAPLEIATEPELAAFYAHTKTTPPPAEVAPLHGKLSALEREVFPSATNAQSTFQGWQTLASPDDLHVRPLLHEPLAHVGVRGRCVRSCGEWP